MTLRPAGRGGSTAIRDTRADVKVLFRRGDWQAWHEALNWLERSGGQDRELTDGAAQSVLEDIEEQIRDRVPIARNSEDTDIC